MNFRLPLNCLGVLSLFISTSILTISLAQDKDAYHPVVNAGNGDTWNGKVWKAENYLDTGVSYTLKFDPSDHEKKGLLENSESITRQTLTATLTVNGTPFTIRSDPNSVKMAEVEDQTKRLEQMRWQATTTIWGILKDSRWTVAWAFHPGKKNKVVDSGNSRADDVLVMRVTDRMSGDGKKLDTILSALKAGKPLSDEDQKYLRTRCEEDPPGDATAEELP